MRRRYVIFCERGRDDLVGCWDRKARASLFGRSFLRFSTSKGLGYVALKLPFYMKLLDRKSHQDKIKAKQEDAWPRVRVAVEQT